MQNVLEKTEVLARSGAKVKKWVCALLVGIPLVLIVVGLSAERRPSWYRPVRLDEGGLQQARLDGLSWIDAVSAKMVRGEVFELVLKDQEVNQWLAVWIHDRSEVNSLALRGLREPSVAFVDGAVRLGALGERSGWRAIFGIDVEIFAVGQSIDFRVGRASVGSLPLPVRWIEEWMTMPRSLDEWIVQHASIAERVGGESKSSTKGANSPRKGSIRNEFVWPNGERAFRIETIFIHSGVARINVQPV